MRPLAPTIAMILLATSCGTSGPVGSTPADLGLDADSFTILWAGDTLLADGVLPLLEEEGYDWPFENLAEVLDADYTIVNLEGPITNDPVPFDPDQVWSYNALPEAAEALARAGVDAGSLANNHGLDRGPAGIDDTVAVLDDSGINGFGAGLEADAAAPLFVETPHGIVAVVGFGEDYGDDRTASDDRVGSLAATSSSIERGYALALDAGARWVVAFVHWGRNYERVADGQRRTAEAFVEAGYDLVVGHGAHLVRPIDIVDGVPVVYSLGNFVFGTFGRYRDDAPGHSILLTTHVDDHGITAATIRCLLTDNKDVEFQPRSCPRDEAEEVLGELHPDVESVDGVGVLRW